MGHNLSSNQESHVYFALKIPNSSTWAMIRFLQSLYGQTMVYLLWVSLIN